MRQPSVKAVSELAKHTLFSIDLLSFERSNGKLPDFGSQKAFESAQSLVAAEKLEKANRYVRWNLLWFVFFCLIFVPLPLWLYPLSCLGGFIASGIVTVWLCVALVICGCKASFMMRSCYRARQQTWLQLYQPQNAALLNGRSPLVHMVLMCAYKEPLEVLVATLDSLKGQTVAKHLLVVVALEEKTPDVMGKSRSLLDRYANVFLHLMVTVHPSGVPGEQAGKSSNSNYGARQAVEQMMEMGIHDLYYCTATTCDSDNIFPAKYFEYLGYDFLRREDRHQVVWQAPLFYNYKLDQRPFFVRVTGIFRAFFMMGILIPQDINTMSVFSLSLRLLEEQDFFIHPAYQMDDIICTLQRMIAIHKRVRIALIPYPVISGPTSGVNFQQEVIEWARQARRWTIGAAEVFHYFCIKWSSFDKFSGFSYGVRFTHYYGFIICGMSLYNLTNLIASAIFNGTGICVPAKYLLHEYFIYLPLVGAFVSYLVYLWAFILDRFGTHLLKVKEEIHPMRNFLHWLTSPLVLLAYSLVEYYAIVEVAIRGKSVCKHGASKKDGLAALAPQKF